MPKAKTVKKHQTTAAEPGGAKPATSGKSLARSMTKHKTTSVEQAVGRAKNWVNAGNKLISKRNCTESEYSIKCTCAEAKFNLVLHILQKQPPKSSAKASPVASSLKSRTYDA